MVTFDLRETVISFSLLRISSHFKSMTPGEACEILYSDKAIEKDMERILPGKEYECVDVGESGAVPGEFRIRLRKVRPNNAPERP